MTLPLPPPRMTINVSHYCTGISSTPDIFFVHSSFFFPLHFLYFKKIPRSYHKRKRETKGMTDRMNDRKQDINHSSDKKCNIITTTKVHVCCMYLAIKYV